MIQIQREENKSAEDIQFQQLKEHPDMGIFLYVTKELGIKLS